jgi:hypothetical protein
MAGEIGAVKRHVFVFYSECLWHDDCTLMVGKTAAGRPSRENIRLRNRLVPCLKECKMDALIEQTVREVMKHKAPEFYARLSSSGELSQLIYISAVEVGRKVRGQRFAEKWDQLPRPEIVRRLDLAHRQEAEEILVRAQEVYGRPN